MVANGDGEHVDIEVDLEDQAVAPRIGLSPKEPISLWRGRCTRLSASS